MLKQALLGARVPRGVLGPHLEGARAQRQSLTPVSYYGEKFVALLVEGAAGPPGGLDDAGDGLTLLAVGIVTGG